MDGGEADRKAPPPVHGARSFPHRLPHGFGELVDLRQDLALYGPEFGEDFEGVAVLDLPAVLWSVTPRAQVEVGSVDRVRIGEPPLPGPVGGGVAVPAAGS